MTSEILIMTPGAVALAADSAVTIHNRKTYNGVNKLFMLSNDPPMGIMTYNLANFLSVPLETLIKEFRKNITKRKIGSLNEIKVELEKFFKFIVKNSNNKTTFEKQFEDFLNDIKKESSQFNSEKLFNLIANMINNFNPKELGDYYNEIMEKLYHYDNQIIELIDNSDSINSEQFIENFKKFFISSLYIESYTGLVISGYERYNLFPSVIHFKVTYLYEDKFIINCLDNEILKGDDILIKTFAQGDVIDTFLNSIDNQFQSEIQNYFDSIYSNYINNLHSAISQNSKIKDEDKKEILNQISLINFENQNLSKSFENFINNLKENHRNQMMKYIASLPKEELSNLAESLINITSLKRKVQTELESVGGPVDVAIITKGDGFIWTKRKHYFEGEMNPQFFERNKKN